MVELLLNVEAEGHDQIQRDLKAELDALGNLQYSQVKIPAPANVLSFEQEVVKFVFAHGEQVVDLTKALIELVTAVIVMRGIKTEKNNPPVIVVVDGKALPLPSVPRREADFVRMLEHPTEPSAPTPRKSHSTKKASKRTK